MITTMDTVHHIGIKSICKADREACQHRPAPTNGESIRKHVKFWNSFVSYIVKDVLCIIDQGKMSSGTCSEYEIRCPKWKMLMHTVMVNSVKGWKIFNISQSDPGSSRDFSCCARIDIVWTSCPRKLCQVKHQITVTNHNSQSDPGSSQDLSCCDRIDIEWPRALMEMGQVRFNKSHAICSTSIVCKFVVEGEVFVKKEKINDEFVSEEEESDREKSEDEFSFEEKEGDFVTTERSR
jgi:hypothetical protein